MNKYSASIFNYLFSSINSIVIIINGIIMVPIYFKFMSVSTYGAWLATGTIAASGTLGQIIPPSIVLIILADQLASATDQAGSIRKGLYKSSTGEISMPSVFDVTSTSAGEMFLGAFVPGLLLVALYMIFILERVYPCPYPPPSLLRLAHLVIILVAVAISGILESSAFQRILYSRKTFCIFADRVVENRWYLRNPRTSSDLHILPTTEQVALHPLLVRHINIPHQDKDLLTSLCY